MQFPLPGMLFLFLSSSFAALMSHLKHHLLRKASPTTLREVCALSLTPSHSSFSHTLPCLHFIPGLNSMIICLLVACTPSLIYEFCEFGHHICFVSPYISNTYAATGTEQTFCMNDLQNTFISVQPLVSCSADENGERPEVKTEEGPIWDEAGGRPLSQVLPSFRALQVIFWPYF